MDERLLREPAPPLQHPGEALEAGAEGSQLAEDSLLGKDSEDLSGSGKGILWGRFFQEGEECSPVFSALALHCLNVLHVSLGVVLADGQSTKAQSNWVSLLGTTMFASVVSRIGFEKLTFKIDVRRRLKDETKRPETQRNETKRNESTKEKNV